MMNKLNIQINSSTVDKAIKQQYRVLENSHVVGIFETGEEHELFQKATRRYLEELKTIRDRK